MVSKRILAYNESREKRIYEACDHAGIPDENIVCKSTGDNMYLIYITCSKQQWLIFKNHLVLTKVYM